MAHRSQWLTLCGIVLVCVAVPHASCHPRPDESQQEIMPYYEQAQEPEHYYPSYEEEGEKPAKERTNLQETDISKEQRTVASSTEVLEGPRQMRQLASSKDTKLNTYIMLFELVGAFYFAWVLIYPFLRDTKAFGLLDLLGDVESTTEPFLEMGEVLDKNSTLQTSDGLMLNKKKKKEDNVVKPLRMFDTISNHRNKTKKGQLQANTFEESVKLYLRAVSGALLIAGFCMFVAYVYAVPWALPHVRAISDDSQNSWGNTSRLDPVDIAMNLLRIEDRPNSRCRERLVCDARYLASTIPYVDDYLPTATSREDFNPVFKYEEAAFIGAQKKDCSIFSCPLTSIQLLTGGF